MEEYSVVARVLHWMIAPLVMAQIAIGWIAEQDENRTSHIDKLHIHMQLGLIIFALMALRVLWRLYRGAPAPKPAEPKLRRRAASLTHFMLYALLLTMPFSGYYIWSFIDAPMSFLGAIEMPDLYATMPEDETGRAVAWYFHVYSSRVLIALIALHIGAALYHEFVLRDRLIRERML
jgi:cytochrome b561